MVCFSDNDLAGITLLVLVLVPLILVGTRWLGYESGLHDGRNEKRKRSKRSKP